MFSLIVCADSEQGIGMSSGEIPWKNSADIQNFKKLTTDQIVIMGRKTWDSLPPAYKPLPNRLNIVISSLGYNMFGVGEEADNVELYDVIVFQNIELCLIELSKFQYKEKEKFIIGGGMIYNYFLENNLVNKIYYTQIGNDFQCDIKINLPSIFKLCHDRIPNCKWKNISGNRALENQEERAMRFSSTTPGRWEYCVFQYQNFEEIQYLKLLEKIINDGSKRIDRTETGTLAIFGGRLEFDVSNGTLPLLTTKFVSFKQILQELLWFLRGETNSKSLEDKGVNIWKGNTSRDFLDRNGHSEYQEGDIGPMYFWQVFHFGAEYKGASYDYNSLPREERGINQFDEVIHLLKTDPFSRRILMTTYNVADRHKGVLYPCHGLIIQFFCEESNNDKDNRLKLSLQMYQRSSDSFLGLPYNIASYTILLHIIALLVYMTPNKVIIVTGDTHLYLNHLEQAKLQISRYTYPFPKLLIDDSIKNKSFKDITENDFKLVCYKSHPSIKGSMSV